jgi:Ca-activated chloride channel family protein
MMGGMGAMGGAMRPGAGFSYKDAEGRDTYVDTVRQVGSKTFYLKGGRWVDSSVKPDEEARAKVVRLFSDDFFALARSQSSELNRYLTFTEPVIVQLGGTVYRFEPEAK